IFQSSLGRASHSVLEAKQILAAQKTCFLAVSPVYQGKVAGPIECVVDVMTKKNTLQENLGCTVAIFELRFKQLRGDSFLPMTNAVTCEKGGFEKWVQAKAIHPMGWIQTRGDELVSISGRYPKEILYSKSKKYENWWKK